MSNKIDKAIELCNKKQFNKAETILRDIVNENNNNSEAWRMLAQIDWFENNEIEKAYNELIEALKIDSKNLWALVLMGNMQSKVYNDIKTASEYYEKVLMATVHTSHWSIVMKSLQMLSMKQLNEVVK